jgi:hypothetical protein
MDAAPFTKQNWNNARGGREFSPRGALAAGYWLFAAEGAFALLVL